MIRTARARVKRKFSGDVHLQVYYVSSRELDLLMGVKSVWGQFIQNQ